MPSIVPLAAIEPALIEELLDAAFGADRLARTAYRMREGTDWLPALSFAALDDDDYLAGTIQVWPIALTDPDGRPHPMLMIGPVAVLPQLQGEGYGKALMRAVAGRAGRTPRSAADHDRRSRLLRPFLRLYRRSYRHLSLPRTVRPRPIADAVRQSRRASGGRDAGRVAGRCCGARSLIAVASRTLRAFASLYGQMVRYRRNRRYAL